MDPNRIRALEAASGLEPSASNLESVGRLVGPDLAQWAFSQWALRQRARAKFERADEMLFTREALEQASHERVAAWRASRFPVGALVADLTCGIGGDLIALARRGPVVGFDLDAERVEYARHNLGAYGLEAGSTLLEQDSMQAEWTWEYAVADPSRRVEGRRTLKPEDFQPDPVEIAKRFEALKLGCIKLSPLLRDEFLESLGPRLEFVSFGGECREAAVWCGSEAMAGRFAVLVESGESLPAGHPTQTTEEPGGCLFEADPAAIRAHCLGTLCERHGLTALGDSNGYLTGSAPVESPWLASFRVLAATKGDRKALREAIREHGGATPIVKSRAKGVDPAAWAKALKAEGHRRVEVAFYSVGPSLRAVLLERV